MNRRYVTLLIPALLVVAPAAHAHPAGASGLLHPLTGFDHLLAILAVGIWSTQLSRRSRYVLPVAFLCAMVVGGLLTRLPIVEQMILGSVLVLGLLVAMAAKLPLSAAASVVAAFALFHGRAHVAEMPVGQSLPIYAAGFLMTTAMLLVSGIALGTCFERLKPAILARACGGLVALAAIALWIA